MLQLGGRGEGEREGGVERKREMIESQFNIFLFLFFSSFYIFSAALCHSWILVCFGSVLGSDCVKHCLAREPCQCLQGQTHQEDPGRLG